MNLQEKLRDLDAKCNGDYWIVRCPICGHREAFIYLDDVDKHKSKPTFKIPIRCNRLNKCGKTSYINNIIIDKIPKIKDDEIIGISPKAIEKFNNLAKFSTLLIGFDFDWRGISNKTLKSNGIIYLKNDLFPFMEHCGKNAFAAKFFKKRCYKDRNLIFPIKNYSGECERLLLRSTKKLDEKAKKEIGMRLKKNSSEVWNRIDLINPEMPIVFITEGVPDGLSIKEVSQKIGTVSLPGVKKYKQLIKEIQKNTIAKSKKYIICFDADDAGREYIHKLSDEFLKKDIQFAFFDLCNYKDLNEFLVNNRFLFFKTVSMYAKLQMDYRFKRSI